MGLGVSCCASGNKADPSILTAPTVTTEPPVDPGKGVSCCHASPDTYTDITPRNTDIGPDFLPGVKLVHMKLTPGQQDEPHELPIHYVYVIKGGRVSFTGVGKKASVKVVTKMATGTGVVMSAGIHQVENVGTNQVEMLLLQSTGPGTGTTPEGHISALDTNPSHYRILAEDDQWMVVKMDLKAGQEDKAHSHHAHVLYGLSECQLSIWGRFSRCTSPEPLTVIDVKPGMVIPVVEGFHLVGNTGPTHASLVYFERKTDGGGAEYSSRGGCLGCG